MGSGLERGVLQRGSPPTRAELQAWVDASGMALELIPPGGAYESLVCEGRVPTREGSWHDVFNVLAFIAWPRAKPALHARVAALQARRRSQPGGRSTGSSAAPPRTREEDALTLLDETALVVSGNEQGLSDFESARRQGAWADLTDLVRRRHVEVRWFGHALLEHLVLGRPPIGAGMVVLGDTSGLDQGAPPGAAVDAKLAALITAGTFDAPRFGPTVPWPDPEVLGWVGLGEVE